MRLVALAIVVPCVVLGCGGSSPPPAAATSPAAQPAPVAQAPKGAFRFGPFTATAPEGHTVEGSGAMMAVSRGASAAFLTVPDQLAADVADPARCLVAVDAYVRDVLSRNVGRAIDLDVRQRFDQIPEQKGCIIVGVADGSVAFSGTLLGFGDRVASVICLSTESDAAQASADGRDCALLARSIALAK